MDRLKGKAAVVTGGAVGIGKACATRMAEEGAQVAIFDLDCERGEALAGELGRGGWKAKFWRCDVSVEAEVKAAIDAAASQFGRLDVLINNAGIAGANKPTHELTEAEWDRVQAVNVKGVFFATKHAIPHLKASGGGSIVNLSSIYGLIGAGDVPPYHASKGAVHLMSKNDALIYAPDRIRVNSVHPGFIWTPMVEGFLADQDDQAEARKGLDALHPLGHVGEPDDIAWACVYLASDEAKFVTGTELVVDGGYTAR
ncbi:SDR family NAD(P)-dependent oxidoreductase [Phenylobacterium sp. J367]|uniref:SDR family NAD(P)-dependent oxidoreductase n=1 Tax=Phenylobacterium sp. J367 TaxID=2898435 RepID=UPI002150A278|nr:glucose 1-dehydrogenase [Phenylobacterium sp. J367]MCR5880829.1 glucose 1-dehydrogenase [Phenylobacterium sp. J367]